MRVKHVTPTQFAAVLKTQVARDITEAETKAIVDAFGDGEMVNFGVCRHRRSEGNRPITRTEDRRSAASRAHPRPGVVGNEGVTHGYTRSGTRGVTHGYTSREGSG